MNAPSFSLIKHFTMRTHWVMDYETLSNCFVAVFEDIKSEERKIFVLHDLRNDLDPFLDFLEKNITQKEWHVSFNGLSFDGQITEYIIRNGELLLDMSGSEAAAWLYEKAQYIIETQNRGDFLEFSPKDLTIEQIDIFKLNHWDNPAKRSSLKWIQYTTDWHNIQDMPIHHATKIESLDKIDEIISYCINDVSSTKSIMYLSKSQIELRAKLTDEYKINLYSASEPKISKELFLHFLSKKTGIKKYDLKALRTYRQEIVVKDIILPYLEFKTAPFQNLLNKFKEVVINPNETKGGFKYSIRYKGVKTDFGLGGIHGARNEKYSIYESTEDTVIMTSDVTSFYPNLAIRNKWSPAHLPKEDFCQLYEWFFEERKKIPKSNPKNYVYKIVLNSTYGLSNDQNSFLYDPQLTMRITINGQLSLALLYEMICEAIPEAVPLMQNTDGLETIIPKSKVDLYYEICKQWQDLTSLELEHDKYQKLVLGDVNNYIALNEYKEVPKDDFDKIKSGNPHYLFKEEDGKYYYAAAKCKGRFEFNNLALHKNKSFLIIPKAIYYYFIHGIEPEDYLASQKNIFDYCAGKKIKGNWKFVIEDIVNGEHTLTDVQNTIRYYMSKKGYKIIKKNYVDGRETKTEADKALQKLFINYEDKPFEEYNIDTNYYLKKIRSEINNLSPIVRQITLNF